MNELYRKSQKDFFNIIKGLMKGIFRKLKPEEMKDTFFAMRSEQGMLLYETILKNNCRNVVEFGASLGISTFYLAAGDDHFIQTDCDKGYLVP